MALRQRKSAEIIRNHTIYDEDQWFIEAIGEAWYQRMIEADDYDKPMAVEGARWRASWAGMCARRIAYYVTRTSGVVDEVEISNPMTVGDAYRMRLGTLLHDDIQAIVKRRFNVEAIVEMKVKIGGMGAGTADVYLILDDGLKVLIEIKTINPTGWVRMFGGGHETGAKYQAIMQAAVSAVALPEQPDEIVLAYFAMEASQPHIRDSKGMPPTEFGRFSCQWSFSKEEYTQIANEEIERMERIIELVDAGELWSVPRVIPDPWKPHHEIVNPARSEYREKTKDGFARKLVKTWECNYCPFQEQCNDDLAEEREAEAKQAVEAVVLAFPGTKEVEGNEPA